MITVEEARLNYGPDSSFVNPFSNSILQGFSATNRFKFFNKNFRRYKQLDMKSFAIM